MSKFVSVFELRSAAWAGRKVHVLFSRPQVLNQQGFGLIELMISLAIASFLVLGLVSMAGSMQNAYNQQSNLAVLHDKERFASTIFGNVLQVGGYQSLVGYNPLSPPSQISDSYLTQVIVASPPGQTYAAQQYIAGSGAASGNGPDVLNVRYYAGAGDNYVNQDGGPNCLGITPTSGAGIYESVLSIAPDPSGNGTKNLVCQVGFNGGTPAATPGGTPGTSVILLDGVSNMQLLFNYYNPSSTLGTYQYYRAIDMPAGDWAGVKSVTVKLTFQDSVICVGATPPPICNFSQTYQVMYGSP